MKTFDFVFFSSKNQKESDKVIIWNKKIGFIFGIQDIFMFSKNIVKYNNKDIIPNGIKISRKFEDYKSFKDFVKKLCKVNLNLKQLWKGVI